MLLKSYVLTSLHQTTGQSLLLTVCRSLVPKISSYGGLEKHRSNRDLAVRSDERHAPPAHGKLRPAAVFLLNPHSKQRTAVERRIVVCTALAGELLAAHCLLMNALEYQLRKQGREKRHLGKLTNTRRQSFVILGCIPLHNYLPQPAIDGVSLKAPPMLRVCLFLIAGSLSFYLSKSSSFERREHRSKFSWCSLDIVVVHCLRHFKLSFPPT